MKTMKEMDNREGPVVDPATKLEVALPVADEIDFVPFWDYVLLDPIPKSKTEGGIVMPDGSKGVDDMARSVCIKAGKGAYRESGAFIENPIQEGDIIYHMAMIKPFFVKFKGKTYLCVAGRDCVARAKRPGE